MVRLDCDTIEISYTGPLKSLKFQSNTPNKVLQFILLYNMRWVIKYLKPKLITFYFRSIRVISAASFGNPACVELLLRNSAARDPKDINGMTPFLCAVAAGQTKCVEVLLDCGADIAARDNFQRSCIHLAVENKREEVLKILLERSGSGLINVPDMHERTALHYAVSSSKIRVIRNKTETNG